MPYEDYKAVSFIGKGGYGEVYKVQHAQTSELFAMKTASKRSDLKKEAEIISELNKAIEKSLERDSEVHFIPPCLKLIDQGSISGRKDFIVTSLHGESSEVIKQMHNQDKFNIVVSLGKQVIRSLKFLHSLGYVHGDIKPQNILFESSGLGCKSQADSNSSYRFVLIDFGISRKFVDEEGFLLSNKKLDVFRGNLEFAACECLQKHHPMPKHDLISLMYTMLYLLSDKQSLWEDDEFDLFPILFKISSPMEEKLQKIIIKKECLSISTVCSNFPCLKDFCKQITKTKGLPKYDELIEKLNQCQAKASEDFETAKVDKVVKCCKSKVNSLLSAKSQISSSSEECDVEETKDSRDSLLKLFEIESKRLKEISKFSKRHSSKFISRQSNNILKNSSESI